jgi:geranylgeranyl diphosphate synthase type II
MTIFQKSTSISMMKECVEKKLSEILSKKNGSYEESLYEAALYSLLSGGKRMRTLLTLSLTEALGKDIDHAIEPACALELIHTYSLIHDDLPCMDDDDLRRGRPTLHKVYGEGHAVLTGDFLLTLAFQVLSEAPYLSAEQKIDLISTLSKRAGGEGMVAGQAVDLLNEGKTCDWNTLSFIHHNKTAALIAASLEFASIIAEVSSEVKELIKNIGYEIGLSFQITDDILDITSDEKTLGKPINSDIENKKNTAVTLLGLDGAKELACNLLSSVEQKRNKISLSSQALDQLLSSLFNRSF